MIQIFTGLPRSGKTYFAVNYIIQFFLNYMSDTFSKHIYLYTNIGGFKFDIANETLLKHAVDIGDEVFIKEARQLNWLHFYEHISKAYEMAEADKDDEEIITYLKYHNYYPALMIIDECYRYFTKKSDPILVWFLAYHGHLGFDIILILQNKGLMHSDYKSFTETFIDAQPKSKGLSNNTLRYYWYASESYVESQLYEKTSLKTKQDTFALYKSGDKHNPKKILYKYIFYLSIVFIFIIGSFFALKSRLTPDTNEIENSSTLDNEYISNQKTHISNSSDIFLNLRCGDRYCWNINSKYGNKTISLNYFKYIVLKYELELLYEETKVEIYSLTPFQKTLSKRTLAKLTDYHYQISSDLKEGELSDLFVSDMVKSKSIISAGNYNFSNTNSNKEDENDE